jgi:tetratricopeptide (TPR) repeat protein
LQAAHVGADLAQELLAINPFKASELAEAALPVLEQENSPGLIAALVAAGATRMMMGNREGGVAAFTRCLEVAEASGEPRALGSALAALGNAAFTEERFDDAARFLGDAIRRFRDLHALTQLGPALAMAGHAHALLGNFDAGIDMLRESLALRERTGDSVGLLFSQLNLADVYDRAGDRSSARALFASAYRSAGASGVVMIQNAAAHGIAVTAADNDARAALKLLAGAIARFIGTTGIDEPITNAALERLRALVDDAQAAETEGRALSDEEFLALAADVAVEA